jgi:hypothetical protein
MNATGVMRNKTKEQRGETPMTLDTMNITALRREYHLVYGLDTESKNKDHLRKRITARRAELAGERAVPRADNETERDPRLPPVGAVLSRVFDGETHRVKVTDVGFEYKRRTYASLSTLAKETTGTNWNGFGFFGLLTPASEGEENS